MGLLEMIESPSDVKKLKVKQLDELATEIRKQIIETVSENGGHLSSNLGAVDILVALYYVFDFPEDKLIFDVGHQCYAHKILSGRKDSFNTVRKTVCRFRATTTACINSSRKCARKNRTIDL